MQQIDTLRDQLEDAVKDLKLNIQNVLKNSKVTMEQAWGTALASAYFIKDDKLVAAIMADGTEAGHLSGAIIDDAKAAAGLMAMNTIYYRFRHMARNAKYDQMSPSLRMNRMMQVTTDKATFELFSIACAALEGCEMCINAHEGTLLKHDMTEEQIHDGIRIAAAVKGFSVAYSISTQ